MTTVHDNPDALTAPARLLRDGEVYEIVGAETDRLVVEGHPKRRGRYAVEFDIDPYHVASSVRVTGIESKGCGKLSTLTMSRDPSMNRVLHMLSSRRKKAPEAGDLLEAMGLADPVPVPSVRGYSRRLAGIVAIAIGLIACLTAAYYRFGITHLRASLQAEGVELARADHAGIFYPYATGQNQVLNQGELIGAVANAESRSFGVSAPCQCYLGDYPLSPGTFVTRGTPVARLYRANAPIRISARIAPESAWRLTPGMAVEIVIADQVYQGHVASVDVERRGERVSVADVSSIVQVEPDEQIDRTLLGGEAEIRVPWVASLVAGWWSKLSGSQSESADTKDLLHEQTG